MLINNNTAVSLTERQINEPMKTTRSKCEWCASVLSLLCVYIYKNNRWTWCDTSYANHLSPWIQPTAMSLHRYQHSLCGHIRKHYIKYGTRCPIIFATRLPQWGALSPVLRPLHLHRCSEFTTPPLSWRTVYVHATDRITSVQKTEGPPLAAGFATYLLQTVPSSSA